jgi:hypothetical protein
MILTNKSKSKIKNRYNSKFAEFIKVDKEELKRLYNETKMSSTDKKALMDAVSYILWEEARKAEKQAIETPIVSETEIEPVKTEPSKVENNG